MRCAVSKWQFPTVDSSEIPRPTTWDGAKTMWNSGITMITLPFPQLVTRVLAPSKRWLFGISEPSTVSSYRNFFLAQISFSSLMGEAPWTNMVIWNSNGLVRLNDSNTFFCWFYLFLQLLFGYKKNPTHFLLKKVYVYTINYIHCSIYIYKWIYIDIIYTKSRSLKLLFKGIQTARKGTAPGHHLWHREFEDFLWWANWSQQKKSKNPRFFPKKLT